MRPVAWVVAVVVLALAGCSGDDASPEPAPPSTVARPRGDSVYDLRLGDCVNGLDPRQDLRVRIVSCRRRHEAEVYGEVQLGSGPTTLFPGVDVARRQAQTACAPQFAVYTGEPPGPGTDLAFTEVLPTSQSWSTGDRRAVCLAVGARGRVLTRSIRPS